MTQRFDVVFRLLGTVLVAKSSLGQGGVRGFYFYLLLSKFNNFHRDGINSPRNTVSKEHFVKCVESYNMTLESTIAYCIALNCLLFDFSLLCVFKCVESYNVTMQWRV